MAKIERNYVWQDKKRVLGMPITFTRYGLTEDRLFLNTGFLSIKEEEILLYRVRDLSLTLTLGQRIFGVGTIQIKSSDKTIPILELKNIKNAQAVKELIHKHVEEMKIQRKMRVGEIMEDHDIYDHEDVDDDNE